MFYDHFKGVGKAIKNLENEYADASGKLEDKGTSIIVTANQMVKLGAKISDKYAIPEMLDVDEISDE